MGVRILPDENPMVDLWDSTEELRMSASLTSEGASKLSLYDAVGRIRGGLGVTPDGIPGLVLYDMENKMRVGLSIADDGTPTIELRSGRGHGKGFLMCFRWGIFNRNYGDFSAGIDILTGALA